MMTVRAHLVQTPQGLRIVLQDTQGIRLGQAQLDTVRYQVKQRQALACQQGKARAAESIFLAGNTVLES